MGKIVKKDLKEKVLKLASLFEVSGDWGRVAGNFDGQFISYGPLQWNVGQGTLRTVLLKAGQETIEKYLGKDFWKALVESNNSLKKYVVANILDTSGKVKDEWIKKFRDLANTENMKNAFIVGAEPYFENARKLCVALGFSSERAYALCFDIAVQNGAPRKDHINEFFNRLKKSPNEYKQEWEKLKLLAIVVADKANPRWRQNVFSRKLGIAVGRGFANGHRFDLEKDFDISYTRPWFVET